MMKSLNTFLLIILVASILTNNAFAQEQIGVASAVNKNTTDLTLEQERKLIDAGYEIIQNHTIETDEIGRAQMLLLDGTAFSVSVTLWGFRERQSFEIRPPKPIVHLYIWLVNLSGYHSF